MLKVVRERSVSTHDLKKPILFTLCGKIHSRVLVKGEAPEIS